MTMISAFMQLDYSVRRWATRLNREFTGVVQATNTFLSKFHTEMNKIFEKMEEYLIHKRRIKVELHVILLVMNIV